MEGAVEGDLQLVLGRDLEEAVGDDLKGAVESNLDGTVDVDLKVAGKRRRLGKRHFERL